MSSWFKCFPRRIMTSYSGLDSDQKACAYTLTMLIYDHDAPLRLPDSMLAGACGFNVRKFKRVLSELVALGKFYIAPSGAIGNELADELLEQRRSAKETGRAGGKKRAANAKAKAEVLANAAQLIDNQSPKDSEKAPDNNGTNQGTLELPFNHKDKSSVETKVSTGADAPKVASHWDLMAEALAEESGKTPKAERAYLANLARELKGFGGDEAFRQIILAAFDEPRIKLHSWLRGAVDRRRRGQNAQPARPTVALCRLGDFRWCHDWSSGENFTTDANGNHPLGRELTAEERAEVARAVDAAQTMRRAA